MPHQANTDKTLAEAGHKQRANGGRLLLIGGVLFAIGLVVLLLGKDENLPAYIGVAIMTLSAPPMIAGGGLLLTGLVSGRASERKPFA
jgi:hypothetical protein